MSNIVYYCSNKTPYAVSGFFNNRLSIPSIYSGTSATGKI